jgi:hypothetical protein
MDTPHKKPRTIGRTIRDIFNWWVPIERIALPVISSANLEPSNILCPRPAALVSLSGYAAGSAVFIQIFDSSTIPDEGASPIIQRKVAEDSDFLIEPEAPILFSNGIVVCSSTTSFTKTLAGSSCFFSAQIQE